MRGLVLIAVTTALALSGCILDRSGTRPDRQNLDGSLPPGLDGGGAADGGGGVDAGPRRDAGPMGVCSPGDAREVPCGGCGTQVEVCESGAWVASGGCTEVPMCMTGATEEQSEACGMCGSHTRTRSCLGCDGWGDWGPYGACVGEGVCAPGTARMGTEACACGMGLRTVTETCRGDCTFEATAAGPCTLQLCNHPLGDACPNDRRWINCPGSFTRYRECRCDGNTGSFVDCDERYC